MYHLLQKIKKLENVLEKFLNFSLIIKIYL